MKTTQIISIKKLDQKFVKYDIETENNHNFFANEILVHNSAFAVEKNPVSKRIEFFKRNTESPISLIDRTLMRYYEKPIGHFNSLAEDVTSKMPTGWRFGFEYFINEKPQEIVYDRVPKNHLVLSYIHVKNGAGKILRTIQEKDELDQWADILQVERSPIIFQGVLTDEQKIKMLEFIDTPFDKLSQKFKTESFVKYIVSVLNPGLKKTVLNEDLDKPIEGIVFRFGSGDNDVVLAKMVDPVFFEMAKQKVSDKNESVMNDIFYITLIDLANFFESLNFNKFKPRGKTYEERYINFICSAFNYLVSQKGDYYEGVDFNEPAFMRKKEFDINLDFIPDRGTKDIIVGSDTLKKLFKIMLASFRKRKKRANGAFTQDVIRQFNGTVDKINNHLSHGLKESEIPTFGEFLSVKGGRRMEEEEEEEARENTPTFVEFKSKMELLNKAEAEAEEKKENEAKVKSKRVNIIVGRFQPFHNGHMEMVGEMHSANGLPTVLVIVHPGHNRSGTSPLEEATVTSMLNNIRSESEGKVIDYKVVKRAYIDDIVEAMRPQYEPILWGAGADRVSGYKMQLELNHKKGNEIKLNDKFQIVETKRTMSGSDVRKAIEEDRFIDFRNMVPRTVQSMYTILRKDVEKYKQPAKI